MRYTSENLERLLTAFYAHTDCPFVLGRDAIVPIACTRGVIAMMSMPHGDTAEEIAYSLDLPLSFVEAIYREVEIRDLRNSSAWKRLIGILKEGEFAVLDQAFDAVVDEFWMRDVPDFDMRAVDWLLQRPAFIVNAWWTDPETRPISQERYTSY